MDKNYTEKLSSYIANYLIKAGASANNIDTYTYAIECLLNTLLSFGIIILISIIFGHLLTALIWIFFFLPIRHCSGGLHAPNHIACLIFSICIGTGCIFATAYLVGMDWLIYIGLVASLVIVFAFAPVVHSNHPLSTSKRLIMKKFARMIIVIETITLLGMHLIWHSTLAYAAILGIISATFSTLIGHFHRQ